MSVTFAHAGRLALALAAVPALAVFYFRFRRLGRNLLPLVSRSSADPIAPLSRALAVRSAFLSLAWVSLAVAAAGPRWGAELVATRREGSSVVFVLDVSRSMTVADVAPSRLAFASAYASRLADSLPDSRLGVVLAKGDAVLSIPLTTDHRSVADLLASASPALLSRKGSNPARGIIVALDALSAAGADSRAVVLLTDGEQPAGSFDEAAREVRSSGATLVIVGVGTITGAEIDPTPLDEDGATVRTALREDALRAAARVAGNGSAYVAGAERGSAKVALDAISPKAAQGRNLSYSSKPVDRYGVFLLLAIVMFCASFLSGGLSWRRE